MRLFFAGGPIDDPMLGSSALAVGGTGFDGPDMLNGDDAVPEARLLLFRGLPGVVASGKIEVSIVAAGREGCEVDDGPVLNPISTLSPRLDIERQDGSEEC